MADSVALKQDDTLTKLIDYFEDYDINTLDVRDAAERDRDYYDNKQYTDDEIAILNQRKQPVITFNLVKRTVDAILGIERQTRTDPKAYPRTPQHEKDAESITDALRYIADNNDFDQIASDGFFNLLVEGTEAIDVCVEETNEKYEVTLNTIDWDRYFYDIHSRKRDFSDSKYHGITIWMDLEDAKNKWPGAADVLESNFQSDGSYNQTFDDKPKTVWASKDENRKRVRINQIFYKEKGVWMTAKYTKSGFVEEPEKSEYLDENGNPEDTIVSASAFVDRDGYRYGYVRQLISPQDEVNKRRSKALHHITQRQTFGSKKSGVDAQTVKRELAKPDGHVDITNGEFGKDFGIIPTQDMAAGNFQLLQEAKDMFQTVGTNTSISGLPDSVRSGRAEQLRQAAGVRELAPIFDIHNNLKRRVYRKIWNRIRQYWTEERWIRITDDEKNLKWVGLNRPATIEDDLKAQFGEVPAELPPGTDISQPIPLGSNSPLAGRIINQLSELDVDIIIEEVPDVANIQSEQFEIMAQLFQGVPEALPILVELSQLRNKTRVMEMLKGNEQQQAVAQQAAQQDKALQDRERAAKASKDEASAEKYAADAQKTGMEAAEIMTRVQ